MGKFTVFARIAEVEYADIVISCQDLGLKLRIYLTDKMSGLTHQVCVSIDTLGIMTFIITPPCFADFDN